MWTAVLVVGMAVVIVRRFVGEPLNARDLIVPPLLLTGLGVYAVSKVEHLTVAEIAWVASGSMIGLALGWGRGLTIQVVDRAGQLYQRYTKWTVVAWLLSFAVGALVAYAATRSGVRVQVRPMTLSIGAGLLGELLVVGKRAYWQR